MFPPNPELIYITRKEVRLTQRGAAALVHVGREQWAAWESGRYRMPCAAWELFLIKTSRQH